MSIELPNIQHPFKKLGKKIESKIRKALYDYSMVENLKTLAIALSGGKDSLCLLFMLKAILNRGFDNIDLLAIHIDGDFSCGASFHKTYLKSICNSLNIKFITKDLKINLNESNCYSCSRKRRKLIFEIAKENNINTVAFGHHKDDNIQTLFLNLFHKAEFKGILPKIKFHKFGITIIRPLIYVDEMEIINFAKQYNIFKTFCKCPLSQKSKRKEIKKIIDDIQPFFPNIKSNLSKASFTYGTKKALFK